MRVLKTANRAGENHLNLLKFMPSSDHAQKSDFYTTFQSMIVGCENLLKLTDFLVNARAIVICIIVYCYYRLPINPSSVHFGVLSIVVIAAPTNIG